MSYYYLAASLPVITMDAPPAMTFSEFQKQCELHLADKHKTMLGTLFGECSYQAESRFIKNWKDRETQLRNTIAKHRAHKQNKDAVQYIKDHNGFESNMNDTVDAAFSAPTPLDRERALDNLRWNTIEELEGFDEFSIDAILGYALKLKIAERWASMDEKTGQSKADELINQELSDE